MLIAWPTKHTKLFSSSKHVVDLKLDPLVVTNLTAAESMLFNIFNACLAASHTVSLTHPPLANPSNSISTNGKNKMTFEFFYITQLNQSSEN